MAKLKIKSLRPKHVARMPEWVEKWVGIGLSCEPANFAEAERGVRGCYRVAGLKEPDIVLHMPSPYAAACAGPIATLMLGAQVWGQVSNQVKDHVSAWVSARVGTQVSNQVSAQVSAQVRDQVSAQVKAQVWDQVSNQVRTQVKAQVEDQVWPQARDQVRAQIKDRVEVQVWAQARDQVSAQVRTQVGNQVWDQVNDQVDTQVRDQAVGQVSAQVRDQVENQVRGQVQEQVWDQVVTQVWTRVLAQAETQVRDQVNDQAENRVWAQVDDQVVARSSNQVSAQVRTQVWDQVSAQITTQVWTQVWDQVMAECSEMIKTSWNWYRGGNLWSGWHAYVTFLRDVAGWQDDCLESYQWDELHALNAGWCWYGEKVAAISDRPERILMDDNGALHCEDGMAARWRDGWGIWSIHGIRVDEQIIMRPETQTLEQIEGEENADVKSIRIDRFGWARYLKESKAALLDHRHNDIENTMEALYASPDGSRRLVATCPTGRVFVMGCPSEVQTCDQAQNWLGNDDLNAKSRCLGRT